MHFSHIAGQDEIKKTLINSINNNQISHCYIFEGPKGMGKYDLALIFAQALLCKNKNDIPCNKCQDCLKINSENHPDLHVINIEETTIKREDIDELINSIYKKPYEANKKIYIIKEAQEMTPQAANTFLKTLEEPPKDSVIILLTTNSNLLLTTIVSRCQHIKLKNVSKETIKSHLMDNYDISEEIAELAAFYSKGILNKAINIVSGKDNLLKFREEIIKLFDKIINSDSEIIYDLENYFEEQKDNIDSIIEIMMTWVRDIMFIKNNMEELIINKDFKQLVKTHGESIKNNSNIIENLQQTSENIKSNVNYKLAVDNMLLRIQEEFR
ncbi:DNA polymerase III subunit delta' [Sedimentibacter hydroxybenzoicus DSM 7310]|uniref:DNA polymerase III subunit delta' n=1 Tax=Sedimentibacter hydroxybenzoicus DSM 7310 TaxID=1123245 RepID=A0A974BIX3_SEDHY|nr:DNA polymerase III subunit delta' [Sedimentibacter hydroxybenzoicus]NYB74084.1 DNA polymerase III subunit delta' [Sedimentibacter hydroxybenzoicus DSM 7310]